MELMEKSSIQVWCSPGNENDLIMRHLWVAKETNADYIVRVPGDNPCVEPEVVDRTISRAMCSQCMVSSYPPHSDFVDGIGCEVWPVKMLHYLNAHTNDPKVREHPHLGLQPMGTPSVVWEVAAVGFQAPEDLICPDLRLDVNTQEDFNFIKGIYEHFGNNSFHAREAIEYAKQRDARLSA